MKISYHQKIIIAYLSAAAVLFIGSAVIRINCHNAMNSEKISFMEIKREADTTTITVMGKVVAQIDETIQIVE